MFTLTEVLAAKPPNSPIGTGTYWQDVLAAAERKVKALCRRKLEADIYTDRGRLTPVYGDTVQYVWYLREPTGVALDFDDFDLLTLNDAVVAEDDVRIEPDRLVFAVGGDLLAIYPGGWLRNDTAKQELRRAVIATMHLLHNADQTGRAQDWTDVRDMLRPFMAQPGACDAIE